MLAASYAWACQHAGWPLVAWIAAETPDQIVTGLAGLAHLAHAERALPDAGHSPTAPCAVAVVVKNASPCRQEFSGDNGCGGKATMPVLHSLLLLAVPWATRSRRHPSPVCSGAAPSDPVSEAQSE
ncbi:hypothetical protein [Sinosporangium siamense]|nr:hypothetical protein [Sinosporangium siamense]